MEIKLLNKIQLKSATVDNRKCLSFWKNDANVLAHLSSSSFTVYIEGLYNLVDGWPAGYSPATNKDRRGWHFVDEGILDRPYESLSFKHLTPQPFWDKSLIFQFRFTLSKGERLKHMFELGKIVRNQIELYGFSAGEFDESSID
jgi:hypothetical protein